jgi:DNA invertase Pin-like site-specific DNA recombinase
VSDLIGYARVSSDDQNLDLQLDALKEAGCVRVFEEKASGALDDRPELARLVDHLRPGDTVAVWRLDRLGRSLRHLIEVVGELEERQVGFCSLTEGINTTTPSGKLVFHLFGALAEFERALIVERTKAGLVAARARGRNGGRPPKMTPEKRDVARHMYESRKHSMATIANAIGVSRATVYRSLRVPGRDSEGRSYSSGTLDDGTVVLSTPLLPAKTQIVPFCSQLVR